MQDVEHEHVPGAGEAARICCCTAVEQGAMSRSVNNVWWQPRGRINGPRKARFVVHLKDNTFR